MLREKTGVDLKTPPRGAQEEKGAFHTPAFGIQTSACTWSWAGFCVFRVLIAGGLGCNWLLVLSFKVVLERLHGPYTDKRVNRTCSAPFDTDYALKQQDARLLTSIESG